MQPFKGSWQSATTVLQSTGKVELSTATEEEKKIKIGEVALLLIPS